jgi:hypothetical protein
LFIEQILTHFILLVSYPQNKACGKVYLVPGQIYVFKKEIFVRRHVVVIGNPTVPPMLDGEDLVRTWHVTDGGLLDLQFVQQLTSDGISPGSLPTISKPLEPPTPKTPIFANPPVVAPVVPGTTSVSLTQVSTASGRKGGREGWREGGQCACVVCLCLCGVFVVL